MANKPQTVTKSRAAYTRNHFAALRAFVQRIPASTITRLYFSEDEDGNDATPAWVEAFLRRMQAELVELALEHGSSVLADHLKSSAKAHGSARLTAVTLKMVEQAALLAVAKPEPTQGVGMWFRPLVARRLKDAGVQTLAELVDFCNRRGGSWWRAVPRIGPGRAQHIVSWLRHHERDLGAYVASDVILDDPFRAPEADLVTIDTGSHILAPLERLDLANELAGTNGVNRHSSFSYIRARHDLDAVRAYLHHYRDQPKTLRAYTKEIERFLLWSVTVRSKPLSSLLADDCEAYKDFLRAPSPDFVGPRASRVSGRWRPFATAELSSESQRYAVRALRAAFAWLVNVRYLAGNPWSAVSDPLIVEREDLLRVDRALPPSLWQRIRAYIDTQCDRDDGAYWRSVRVALLLSGDSGLRREELVNARREAMSPTNYGDGQETVWQLSIVGKRNKQRTVPVSPATIAALTAHWRDRGLEFDTAKEGPLLSTLFVPRTAHGQKKYADGTALAYHVDGINKMIAWAMKRLIAEMSTELSVDEIKLLAGTSPHAFRHTFGTHAAAEDVPLDVVQRILGHASLQTTSVYVQAEKLRMLREAATFYRRPKSEPA
ncbi:tyrosine-type recombinase/integrase (plasmid) [Caballeronia sp. NK8]|uniref:site-specific integrase n=1 Tax=Caballeronia sp. NK8 TaxID=140098 RepID=UPI001BB5B66B|nr:site-specific integrase [Caballeronia sp. NK8]BCQ29995.1 tyrosine-type recombinase/integrase [Caballeronia sp. NK8]